MAKLAPEEPIKKDAVPLTDTRADPRTVVVVGSNTLVALLAVLCPQRNFNVADGTVLELDESEDVRRTIFFLFDHFHLWLRRSRLPDVGVVAIGGLRDRTTSRGRCGGLVRLTKFKVPGVRKW